MTEHEPPPQAAPSPAVDAPPDHPVHAPPDHPVHAPPDHPVHAPPDHPVHAPPDDPVDEPIDHPMHEPTDVAARASPDLAPPDPPLHHDAEGARDVVDTDDTEAPYEAEPPLLEPIEPPHAVMEDPVAPQADPSFAEERATDKVSPELRRAGETTPPSAEAPPVKTRRDPLPWLFGVFIILLIGGVVYLWRHPFNGLTASAAPDERVVALQDQVASLQQRLTALEQRPPAPPPADPAAVLAPLEQRVTALEQRPAPAPEKPASATPSAPGADKAALDKVAAQAEQTARDLASKLDALAKQQAQLAAGQSAAATALTARLDAEQQRLAALASQAGQVPVLTARLEAQERQVGALSGQAGQVSMLAGRLDTQEKQLGSLSGQAGQISSVAGRLDAQEKQVGALASETSKIDGLAARAARTARIQAANAALEAGRPLGDLPDAPPALARFQSSPPPTEAALRLAFPDAVAAAQTAARPDTGQLPFWEAVQARAQELITVRRGDQVVVGDPSAGVIARARHALDAGDLAGAVGILHELTGAQAAAFAAWIQQAQSLLDARAALATLAAHA